MNTILLKYAVEIEKCGSITQAAQNMYMAQPNLSKAIKDLEKEVGYAIFKRTSNGIAVTEKGNEFLYHAQKMLEQLEELERISKRENERNYYYKVAIPRGSYLANGFTSFVGELPFAEGMEITIHETNTIKIMDSVANRGYNMGIIRYQHKDEDYYHMYLKNNKLEQEIIWEFEYVLVMSKDHPLAKKEKITCDDLGEYVKITHGDLDVPHEKAMDRKLYSKKDNKSKTIYVYERGSQFDLLSNIPTTYMWVSPIPNSILQKNHLVQRSCKAEDNMYKDVLIYRSDYQMGEIDKLFQKKLYASKVEVASTKYK